jgi:SAM-dependent methyltransferase
VTTRRAQTAVDSQRHLADATGIKRAADTYTSEAQRYWDHQRPIGEMGGEFNRWKFAPYVRPEHVVVDFGCGGGYLLAGLPGTQKIGVDPSPLARIEAARQGISVVASVTDLAEASADVVVSNHALEHTLSPLDELQGIARILRPGGRLVLALPIDDWRSQRDPDPNDPDRHLYAWTPRLIANLLSEAGFEVERAHVVTRAWHPRVTPLLKRLPAPLYALAARTLSVALRRRELHAVARRP